MFIIPEMAYLAQCKDGHMREALMLCDQRCIFSSRF